MGKGTAGAAVLGLLAVVAVAIAGPGTAGAEKRGAVCHEGRICVWEHNDFDGTKVKLKGIVGVSNKLADLLNNGASSLKNTSSKVIKLYDKKNAKGDSRCFEPGDSIPNLGDYEFNDLASSSKVTNQASCPV